MPLLVATSNTGVSVWRQSRAHNLSPAPASHPGRQPGWPRDMKCISRAAGFWYKGECNVLMGGCDKRPSSPGLTVLAHEGLKDPGQFSVEWKNLNL